MTEFLHLALPWLVVLLVCIALGLTVLMLRQRGTPSASDQLLREALSQARTEAQTAARESRSELAAGIERAEKSLLTQLATVSRIAREENDVTLQRFSAAQNQQLSVMQTNQDQRLTEMRALIEQRLELIRKDNGEQLEKMRQTVDEKLHATLEQRLGASFKLVSSQLEAVHKGIGEMQTLAVGVGDLKRVLSNVKTRGTWGEVQLGALLAQVLTTDQYAVNVATRPGSSERVEFALRLPGRADEGQVWLPIDSKFPVEDYDRLLAAQERGDTEGVNEASKAIETRIKAEARTIRDKYIEPPHTTDFALLFLPTEGLYAEALRRDGLADLLQREFRVTLAGPSTLTALLNSLQMGFRTLAIEKRSSEVWAVLAAVKTEFGKFGEVLAKTKAQLETVARSIDQAETRTRQMERKLKTVEALPDAQSQALLGASNDAGVEET